MSANSWLGCGMHDIAAEELNTLTNPRGHKSHDLGENSCNQCERTIVFVVPNLMSVSLVSRAHGHFSKFLLQKHSDIMRLPHFTKWGAALMKIRYKMLMRCTSLTQQTSSCDPRTPMAVNLTFWGDTRLILMSYAPPMLAYVINPHTCLLRYLDNRFTNRWGTSS